MDRGDWGVKEKKTYNCVYLFEDGLSVFKSHEGERKKEKVIVLVVTRGGISCREIAVYCFCDRGNVNWPCGCVTSPSGRRRTKWTQNTPWERSQFLM